MKVRLVVLQASTSLMCRYRWMVLDVGVFLEPYNHTRCDQPVTIGQKLTCCITKQLVKRPRCNACVYACSVVSESMDCSPPGSSVHRIFQARILEWVAISSFGGSSQSRDWTWVSGASCIGRWILYHCAIKWTTIFTPWRILWSYFLKPKPKILIDFSW